MSAHVQQNSYAVANKASKICYLLLKDTVPYPIKK